MITPPPLPPASPCEIRLPEKPPFAKQAAKLSAFFPLAAIGIQIVGTGSANGDSRAMLLFSGIGTLIIISGIVLGVIALFGIRRHGFKGIFGFALTGLVINTFLIVAACLTFQAAKHHADQIRQIHLKQELQLQNP